MTAAEIVLGRDAISVIVRLPVLEIDQIIKFAAGGLILNVNAVRVFSEQRESVIKGGAMSDCKRNELRKKIVFRRKIMDVRHTLRRYGNTDAAAYVAEGQFAEPRGRIVAEYCGKLCGFFRCNLTAEQMAERGIHIIQADRARLIAKFELSLADIVNKVLFKSSKIHNITPDYSIADNGGM